MNQNKFLFLSLEDNDTKKIANTLNNKTSKKILDYLANKDGTESEISKELNLPASTVNYNIEQLINTKLIICKKFHYSEKGKEVKHYSLTNKYIIITPKNEKDSFIDLLKKISPAFIIIFLGTIIIEYFNKSSQIINNQLSKENIPMMVKSMQVESVNQVFVDNTSFLSIPTQYFLIGSLITIFFIFFYLYFKNK